MIRELAAPDGTELQYRVWPAADPRAAILCIHGLFEHSGRYDEFGTYMSDAGFSTFVLDLRGHGGSGGRRGYVEAFQRFIDDVGAFRRHVDASLPAGPDRLPRVLLAHSMGGLIGIRALQTRDDPWMGAVITSPWLGTAAPVPGWQKALAAVLQRIWPTAPFPAGIDPADLSHDPERVADYTADPKIYDTLTPRLWGEVQAAWDAAFREVEEIRLPALFLLAGDDRVVSTERGLALARAVPAEDVTIRVLDGYFHEVLQEKERAGVMAEIRSWIEARLP